jgi:hypothetical protein
VFKNVASQRITFLLIDTSANVPKTGDAANLTAYVSIDDGAVTALGDTSATELSSTNALGLYSFDLTQAETNGDKLVFTCKSSTSGVRAVPVMVYTLPTTGILAPTTAGRTLGVEASGNVYAELSVAALASIVNDMLDQFSDDSGTAQAGAAGTITLRSGAVATDDYYNGAVVNIYSGTGAGQSRRITDYNGTTKVATVDSNWATNPDNTSTYFVIGRIT